MMAGGTPTLLVTDLLIDGTGRDPIGPAAVLVEQGRITRVGARDGVGTARHQHVIDLSGRVLLPGLVDAHSHIFYRNLHFRERSVVIAVARAIGNAAEWLAQGVTTSRDMGTRENLDIGLRDAIAGGLVAGPRLFVSGSGLAMSGAKEGLKELTIEVTGEDQSRYAARQQLRAGADLIKLFATGGVVEMGGPQMTVAEMRAAVEEAHKAGKSAAAHAIGTEGIRNALDAGVDAIEHGMCLTEELAHRMVARNVALVPTLSLMFTITERGSEWGTAAEYVEKAKRLLAAQRESVRIAHEAGVLIAAGTDCVYDDTVAMECSALVRAGLPPASVIRAATQSGARVLGLSGDFGTLEVGRRADIIGMSGNPLEDISALKRVDYIMKDGETIKSVS